MYLLAQELTRKLNLMQKRNITAKPKKLDTRQKVEQVQIVLRAGSYHTFLTLYGCRSVWSRQNGFVKNIRPVVVELEARFPTIGNPSKRKQKTEIENTFNTSASYSQQTIFIYQTSWNLPYRHLRILCQWFLWLSSRLLEKWKRRAEACPGDNVGDIKNLYEQLSRCRAS